jgi:serine protease
MKTWLRMAVVATFLVEGVAFAQQADIITPENAIPNQFIVVLNDEAPTAARVSVASLAQTMAVQYRLRVTRVYQRVLTGFVVTMSPQAARVLATDPRVRYIEQDSVVSIAATQTSATWGLDRIDQRDLPLSNSYTYNTDGLGVHAYIIDTGIRATHTEFTGRISNGFSAINDGRGTSDCNGHGTHVSGTVGGTTWGVAKQVMLHPVRVLDCNGSGTTSGVIAGVDWVRVNHATPAVANMSLGGGASTALDDAVRNSIASGVTYAIAAGNSSANACNSSPSRVGEALVVGASTSSDVQASFSNFGSCVDLYAPGQGITSAWITNDSATNTISGTSMATPHVTGVAALYLSVPGNSSASPATVNAAVVNIATTDHLTGLGAGSPNRLLYSLFDSAPVDNPPVPSFTVDCGGRDCVFQSTSTDDNGIANFEWVFGDGATTSGPAATVTHSYGSDGTFTASLTVTDTAGQSASTTRTVTVSSGGAPCTACTRYTGSLSGTGDYDIQPNGTWYFRGVSGTHRGWLSGPAGTDFDLYLQKWNGFHWVTVARSESATPQEQIAYAGSAGYYRWIVYSFSGSGSYSFWLQTP